MNIIQEKTGNILHLPLIKEVKSAIEDYLSFRLFSPIEQLFITVKAPYRAVTTSTLRNALKKNITLSGIDPGNRKRGPHVLSSSLASSMTLLSTCTPSTKCGGVTPEEAAAKIEEQKKVVKGEPKIWKNKLFL